MANALQMVPQSLCLRPGAHNQNISSIETAVKSAVQQRAIDYPPQAQRYGDKADCQNNDTPWYLRGMQQIQRTRQQQSSRAARLNA